MASVPASAVFATVKVPTLVPGASVPPELMVTAPAVPVPPSVAPLATVVALEVLLPFTSSVPAFTAVAPV
jgi:hypothetical protein